MRILIFGDGPLTTALLSGLGRRDTVKLYGRYEDIADGVNIFRDFAAFQPTLIVNCFEMDSLAECERFVEHAIRRNAVVPAKLAMYCRVNGATLVQISTDYVFSGFQEGGPYADTAEPYPVNAYGLSKFMGEQVIRSILEPGRFLIVRHSWLYGDTVKSGYPWEAARAKSIWDKKARAWFTRRAFVSNREQGTPTHTGEVAWQLWRNLRMNDWDWQPVVHIAPREAPITWFDFLEDEFPLIQEVDPKKAGLEGKATIPARLGLIPTPGWETPGYASGIKRFRAELGHFQQNKASGEGS